MFFLAIKKQYKKKHYIVLLQGMGSKGMMGGSGIMSPMTGMQNMMPGGMPPHSGSDMTGHQGSRMSGGPGGPGPDMGPMGRMNGMMGPGGMMNGGGMMHHGMPGTVI